jgi:DNA gyrase inhibitor GyrI
MKRLMHSLVILALSLFGARALAVEEPAFHTVVQDGAFEIRDYPALVVAEVSVTGAQREAASKGFRLLASYIFGANRGKQSIAMTAPVTQAPQGEKQAPVGEKIAMTAPVTQMRTEGAWIVRFTMPSGYTLATLPQPNDARVHLRETPPTRFAVIRFSGVARPDNVAAETAKLSAWVQARHLHETGPASLSQYDPPWTLWFLRRNEVMIPIER